MKREFISIVSMVLSVVILLSVMVVSVGATGTPQADEPIGVYDEQTENEYVATEPISDEEANEYAATEPISEEEALVIQRRKQMQLAQTSVDYYTEITSGDWVYQFDDYDNGNEDYVTVVSIYDYLGTDADIRLPETIDGYSVKTVDFWHFSKLKNIKTVYIPEGIEHVYGTSYLTSLKSFSVSSDNTAYTSKNGILFSKDMTSLEAYPVGKTSTSYTVPSTVKDIYISDNNYLKKITLHDNVEEVRLSDCDSITTLHLTKNVKSVSVYCSKLKSFSVSSSNKNYSVVDGVLYDKKKTYIVNYPYGKTATTYNVPSGVTYVNISSSYLENLVLPASVEQINLLYNSGIFPKMKSYTVSSKNKNFSSKDGVLFNKKKTVLLAYPVSKTATSYTIPSTVKSAERHSMYDNKYLKKLVIPAGFTGDVRDRIAFIEKLEEFVVSSSNKYYYTKDGVLYSKDKQTLIMYPQGKKNTEYTVLDQTKTIGSNAFSRNKYIKKVNMNKNVVCIVYGAFYGCSSLKSVSMSKKLKEIGSGAFYDCANLKSITLPKSVTYLYADYGERYDSKLHKSVKVSGFKSRGYKGTAVETYAKEKGLTFVDITPKSVKTTKSKITLGVKEVYNLDEVITPTNNVDKVKWTTSNSKVATVSTTGVVTAKKAGTATIKVTTSNGKVGTCKVTVKNAPTKLGLNKYKVTLKVKKKVNLNPKFKSGQYAMKVTFKSSNNKVAVVSETGVVTAKKKGTVTITATTYNGKKRTCKITVK